MMRRGLDLGGGLRAKFGLGNQGRECMLAASDMTGKAVLVTGAAAGLGKASALRLAELGADIAMLDRDKDGLAQCAEAVRTIGRKALQLPLDLAERANCKAAIAATVHE